MQLYLVLLAEEDASTSIAVLTEWERSQIENDFEKRMETVSIDVEDPTDIYRLHGTNTFLNHAIEIEPELKQRIDKRKKLLPGTKVKVRKFRHEEKGIVKSIKDNKIFIVFKCADDWDNYQNYTGNLIRNIDLISIGWGLDLSLIDNLEPGSSVDVFNEGRSLIKVTRLEKTSFGNFKVEFRWEDHGSINENIFFNKEAMKDEIASWYDQMQK